jgi:hypothetical protein
MIRSMGCSSFHNGKHNVIVCAFSFLFNEGNALYQANQ